MKAKLIIAAILVVILGVIALTISLNSNARNDNANNPVASTAPVTEDPEELPEEGEGRPTSYPGWEEGVIIAEPIPEGEGAVDEDAPDEKLPDYYYSDILLPFVDEAGIQQGSGLRLTASELPADTEFVATIVPRGNADFEPIEAGSVTSDDEGVLDQEKIDLPTDLATGTYALNLKGGDKEFTINFYIVERQ